MEYVLSFIPKRTVIYTTDDVLNIFPQRKRALEAGDEEAEVEPAEEPSEEELRAEAKRKAALPLEEQDYS